MAGHIVVRVYKININYITSYVRAHIILYRVRVYLMWLYAGFLNDNGSKTCNLKKKKNYLFLGFKRPICL